jgi:hypothetical protein
MSNRNQKRAGEKPAGARVAPRPATEEGAEINVEVKNAAPPPAEEKKVDKAKTAVYTRGKDWAIVERIWQDRAYYQVRTYESERSLPEKLAEAFEVAAKKGLTEKVPVVYTRFFRDKYAQIGFYRNTLIIKIPEYISYLRVKWLLDVAEKTARLLYGDAAVDVATEEEAEEAE